jgi:hypothetical protein
MAIDGAIDPATDFPSDPDTPADGEQDNDH